MKKIFVSLMALCLAAVSFAAGTVMSDNTSSNLDQQPAYAAAKTFAKVEANKKITVNGEEREYKLYVPQDCPEDAPMVVVMHGTGGSMNDKALRFWQIADKEKFVVVFPQGRKIYFPVFGGTLPGWESTGEYSKDVDFIRQLVQEVGDEYKVDRKRVYCCGFSNGGMNTYSLTNFCTDIFAAFGSISGFPINEFHMHHVGARPVPFIHIHGKQDDFVKYSLVPVIIENMVARNGANPVAKRTSVAGKYDKNVFEATEGSFPVVYYEIDGMGHNDWTDNTEDGNSSQTMWNFFKQYTLDTPCDETLKWRPNIDAEGYEPKNHGWRMNVASYVLLFGNDVKSDANQNVYRSLQFVDGNYKLCCHVEGAEGTEVTFKLQLNSGKKTVVLNETVGKDGDVTLCFNVDSGWGEYKLMVTRKDNTANVKITNLAIYSATEEEMSVGSVKASADFRNAKVYSLGGIALKNPERGINIFKNDEGEGRKIIVRD